MNVAGKRRRMVLDYDTRHQLLGASDDIGYEASFGYTAAGRVASAYVRNAPARSFTPISRSVGLRLPPPPPPPEKVSARDVTYAYDGIDPEAPAELVGTDGTVVASYQYDLSGNLIGRHRGDAQDSFEYDGDDQQRLVTEPDGSTELYFYDHTGARMLALTRDPSGAPTRLRQWFGTTEIWYDGVGNVDKTWVHVGLGTPVARIENNQTVEYTVHSMLGNLLVSTDSYGVVQGGFTYGPFGEILDTVGDPDEHLRRFNGKEFDQSSGLSYYGVRYYDVESLSWTQADPLYRFVPDLAYDEPRLMNLYVFSLNNPVRYVDPDGREVGNRSRPCIFRHSGDRQGDPIMI